MDCPPIPQFYLDFLLRSKAYSKEHPPSTSNANRFFFPLSSANYAAAQWFILVQGA